MRLYRRGDFGEPVRDIQDRLSALGYSCDPDSPGGFGAATHSTVVAFQQARGLDPDGIVGPETWRVLVESGYRLGDRLLYHRHPMQRGDDVAELQRRLNSLGFDAGKVDGIFGPDTLEALLDFQHNRGMAEDGKAGPEVALELTLVRRATDKEGRDRVREREWVRSLPITVAGQRIMIDAFARDEREDAATWSAATGAATTFQELGAHVLLSRSADTRPPERVRALRANRAGADLVMAFSLPRDRTSRVFYFASQHSHSHAGRLIAAEIGHRLGLDTEGRATPILKETRPPAVIVCAEPLTRDRGTEAALAVDSFFNTAREE